MFFLIQLVATGSIKWHQLSLLVESRDDEVINKETWSAEWLEALDKHGPGRSLGASRPRGSTHLFPSTTITHHHQHYHSSSSNLSSPTQRCCRLPACCGFWYSLATTVLVASRTRHKLVMLEADKFDATKSRTLCWSSKSVFLFTVSESQRYVSHWSGVWCSSLLRCSQVNFF